MEFKYKIKVGETEIEINESAANQREFFEKVSFFSGLPTKAPNGATDLKIVYRKTKSNDEFYSIVSESEKVEYKFGIHKNADKTLFPKGWEPLYIKPGEESDNGEQEQAPAKPAGKPAFAGGAKTPAAKAAPQAVAQESQQESAPEEQPAQEQAPAPSAPAPKIAGLGNLPKAGAPATATAPVKTPAANNPAVNSVLNKYLNKPKA